jgi:hypothetical protein
MLTFVFLCFLVISLVACGGGGSSTPPPTPTPPPTITITPSTANVPIGGSQTFTSGAVGVTWALTGPGTINQNGVYLAPSTFPGIGANTITVTATLGSGTGKATGSVVYPNDNGGGQSGPIKLGTSGGNTLDINGTGCCIGTLGSLINRGGSFFILSNNHVLDRSGNGNANEAIDQPGPTQCFSLPRTVANLTQGAAIKPTNGNDSVGCQGSTAPICGKSPSNVDAAIAAVAVGQVDTSGTILDLGAAGPTSIADAPPSATLAGPATPGQAVAKSGRTSGLTCSTVQSIGGPVRVSYDSACGGSVAFDATFQSQIIINGGSFIRPGDSGSLLITSDTARPMGLLYAAGDTSAVANPIADVISAFTQAGPPVVTPTIVGGPDHSVSCAPTASLASTQVPASGTSTLTPSQRQTVAAVRERNARVLMSDAAIKSVEVGASADNPKEGALLIQVSGATKSPVPATIEGVRTRLLSSTAAGVPPITQDAIKSSLTILHAHQDSYMAQRGIQGMGVGRSDDNPAETAIVIYTITGVAHDAIPAAIDGVRTKVVEGSRFRAY